MSNDFPVGSIVRLKTGGPEMKIIIRGGVVKPTASPKVNSRCTCSWIEDNKEKEKAFDVDELVLVG